MDSAEKIRYTYADYANWDDKIRYELIDGVAYAMASPSRMHQKISGELYGRLWQFLRGKPCEAYHAPFDVRLNADSFDDIIVQPDIFVVCDESKHDGKSLKGAPDMVMEILPPFNLRRDTVTKARLYRKAKVREYWIVDPNAKTVQTYILKNGSYTVRDYSFDDIIPVHVLKGCEINLADVFYDVIEPESEIRQKIIEALEETGANDAQIAKVMGKLSMD